MKTDSVSGELQNSWMPRTMLLLPRSRTDHVSKPEYDVLTLVEDEREQRPCNNRIHRGVGVILRKTEEIQDVVRLQSVLGHRKRSDFGRVPQIIFSGAAFEHLG